VFVLRFAAVASGKHLGSLLRELPFPDIDLRGVQAMPDRQLWQRFIAPNG